MFSPQTHHLFARPSIRRALAAALVALVSWAGVAPAYAQKSCLPAKTTTVRANQRWVDSGRTLTGGEIVTITAKGTWTTGPMPAPLLGPGGLPFECRVLICPDPNLSRGALIARVGDFPPFAAAILSFYNKDFGYNGSISSFTGALAFQINDLDRTELTDFMADNTGQMKVTTKVCYPATLYTGPNFTGELLRITEDTDSLLGFNDDVSSLRVAPGWKIEVFQNDNQTGASQTFTADTADLSASLTISCPGGTWSDCMSSVKVSPK